MCFASSAMCSNQIAQLECKMAGYKLRVSRECLRIEPIASIFTLLVVERLLAAMSAEAGKPLVFCLGEMVDGLLSRAGVSVRRHSTRDFAERCAARGRGQRIPSDGAEKVAAMEAKND